MSTFHHQGYKLICRLIYPQFDTSGCGPLKENSVRSCTFNSQGHSAIIKGKRDGAVLYFACLLTSNLIEVCLSLTSDC